MSMTDPIADFLTRIRNGIMSARETVDMPSSTAKVELARILKEQGYIDNFSVTTDPTQVGKKLSIQLRYTEQRTSVISGLKRVSRPGQRTYVNTNTIPRVLGGMGTAIISTSRGVMTGHQARHLGVGGEVVAYVW